MASWSTVAVGTGVVDAPSAVAGPVSLPPAGAASVEGDVVAAASVASLAGDVEVAVGEVAAGEVEVVADADPAGADDSAAALSLLVCSGVEVWGVTDVSVGAPASAPVGSDPAVGADAVAAADASVEGVDAEAAASAIAASVAAGSDAEPAAAVSSSAAPAAS